MERSSCINYSQLGKPSLSHQISGKEGIVMSKSVSWVPPTISHLLQTYNLATKIYVSRLSCLISQTKLYTNIYGPRSYLSFFHFYYFYFMSLVLPNHWFCHLITRVPIFPTHGYLVFHNYKLYFTMILISFNPTKTLKVSTRRRKGRGRGSTWNESKNPNLQVTTGKQITITWPSYF